MKRPNREINIFNVSMLDVLSCALGAFLLLMLIMIPFYNKEAISYQKEIHQLKKDLDTNQNALGRCQDELAKALHEAEEAQTRATEAQHRAKESDARAESAQIDAEKSKTQAEEAQAEAEKFKTQAKEALRQAEESKARAEEARINAENLRGEAQKAKDAEKECKTKLSKILIVAYIRWSVPGRDVDLYVTDLNGNTFSYYNKKVSGYPGELSEDSKVGPGNEVWEIREPRPGRYVFSAQWYKKNDKRIGTPTAVSGRVVHRDGRVDFKRVTLTHPGDTQHLLTINVTQEGDVQIL